MKPIQININPEREGCYYELEPLSRRRVKAAYPDVKVAPMVFIGYQTRNDFEAVHGPMWQQVAMVLTGLSMGQLADLGGVDLFDVTTQEIIAHVPLREAA
ncbi:MAG: hypothetical protein R3F65_01575 [bacterium]|nr:hypothetical protein [Myxococcales bacterium]